MTTPIPQWLHWARQLQAIAQTGITYTQRPYPYSAFDSQRYEAVREIAAEIMVEHSTADLDFVRNLFAGEVGHATPKIDVRGVVFRDDAILLVRERADGLWTLPGGWIDIDESPSAAAEREIFEESGYLTKAAKVLAIYDRNKHDHPPFPHHAYTLFVRCELLGGEATTSIETDGIGFFRRDEIPSLSVIRVTPGQIARMFEHHHHPDWPTDFD
jgi:ADP-ribose pyrophosphatase YjhB (NUDIX family)